MSPVDVAMVRSLQGGAVQQFKDVLARSLAAGLAKRDIVSDTQGKVNDVQTAFSSWDNCMKASFCKWPVIAVIVVGSLIVIGVVWCIIRCCCCGLSCCCSCFQCLKCCGNCCGCCDPPGAKRHKYLDEPYIPPHHGYQQQAPMQAPSLPVPTTAPKQPGFEPPQYAEFDVSKKGSEDSLPQMPSWEGAGSKKVMVEHEEVEMSNLKKSPTPSQAQQPLATPSAGPVSPLSPGPHSPYGPPRASPNGYMPSQGQQPQGYGRLPQGQSQQSLASYGSRDQPGYNNYNASREPSGFGLDQPYDDPTTMLGVHEQRQPAQSYMNNGQNHQFAPPVVAELGQGRQSPGPGRNGYGQDHQFAPPVVAELGQGRQSPGPGRNGYGYGQNHMNQGFAEMPAEPAQPGRPGQQPLQEAPNGYGMRRQATGDNMPDGYAMRRQGTGDSSRPPYGTDPHMRNSPGPRRTPGPPGGGPYGQPPRASPAPREPGYGRPGYSPPRDQVNRAFSPAPERRFTPAPERQHSPAPNSRQNQEYAPAPLTRPSQSPASFAQSPPQSPITNNSGFDFTSGYARAANNDRRPSESRESPTKEAYPGYKPYKPAQEGWSGV